MYVFKNCHQHCYAFENLRSSWGVGILFSKLLWGLLFFYFILKVRCFKSTIDHRPFLSKFDVKLGSWGMIHTGDYRPF